MASKYIQKFPIPEGFPEILHDLAKEILRNQPSDIIEFSALYFKCLQDKVILDYPRKGKNIPCDFKTTVPKTSTKEELNAGKKNITRDDEEDHAKAFKKSKFSNDPAIARVEDDINNMIQSQEMNLKSSVEFGEKDLLSLTSSFVEDVINRKIIEYRSQKKLNQFAVHHE